MQTLWDFLTFKIMISPDMLILGYYLGVIGVPLFAWWLLRYLTSHFDLLKQAKTAVINEGKTLFNQLSLKYRVLLVLVFISLVLMLEIAWRMMFEFLIAYFQMHDALQQLLQTSTAP